MPTLLGLTNDARSSTPQGMPPAQPRQHISSSTTLGANARLDTISKRNHHAALDMETQLWRALCDNNTTTTTSPSSKSNNKSNDGAALEDFIAHDCVMINPLFFPGSSTVPALGPGTRPTVADALRHFRGSNSGGGGGGLYGFRFHGEPLVVEVDLMAVALVYRVSLFVQRRGARSRSRSGRRGDGGGGGVGSVKEVVASASSTWRQTAGADWVLVAFHMEYVGGGGGEDYEEEDE